MGQRNMVVILSDIHIGNEAESVWYRKKTHEPYLRTVLEYVIEHKEEVEELVLLGDIFDLWQYDTTVIPPSFDEIIENNPGILGVDGMLCQTLNALQGRITFVPGNHDMMVTKTEIEKLKSKDGYQIRYATEPYIPEYDSRILFSHGNDTTVLNAPYFASELSPLPLGYFISRAVSHSELEKEYELGSVGELPDPNQKMPVATIISEVVKMLYNPSKVFVDTVVDKLSQIMGVKLTDPIVMSKDKSITLEEVKTLYHDLLREFPKTQLQQGVSDAMMIINGLAADIHGKYMPWFAKKYALEMGADLVVMGHSHQAVSGIEDDMIQYGNTGTMCPRNLRGAEEPITFGMIDLTTRKFQLYRMDGSTHFIPYQTSLGRVITIDGIDHGCYVSIINETKDDYVMVEQARAIQGQYVVLPPQTIRANEMARFWMQGVLTRVGAKGEVTYRNVTTKETRRFEYCCSIFRSNQAQPAPFRAKVEGEDWLPEGQIPRRGEPLHVEFYIRNKEI